MTRKDLNKNRKPPVINDNINDNLTPCFKAILNLLHEPKQVIQLSHLLKRQRSNVCRDLKKLEILNLVTQVNGSYQLSGYALSLMRYHSLDGCYEMITPARDKVLERADHHNVSFVVDFWDVPDWWDKKRGCMFDLELPRDDPCFPVELDGVVDEWNNNKAMPGTMQNLHFGEYTVVCSPKGVRVYVPRVVRDEPGHAVRDTWRLLVDFLPKLERHLGLNQTALYKDGRLNVRVSTEHLALFKSVFAKFFIDEKGYKRFSIPADDGKERIVVDNSEGQYHLEGVHPGYALSDMEYAKEFVRQIGDREAPLPKDTAQAVDMIGSQMVDINNGLTDFQLKTIPVINHFAENIKAHTGTAEALLVAAESLNRAIDRMDKVSSKDDHVVGPFDDLDEMKRIRRSYLSHRK